MGHGGGNRIQRFGALIREQEKRRGANVERYLAVQIVVAGDVEVGAVRLPYGGDAGCSGKVAVGGKCRVLIADEADDTGL